MTQAASGRAAHRGFGTFAGVFRPIVLTVLGAMLYLREGWLVGTNGLGGALLIIAAATAITGVTALSLASIATNVRVKPGGAFAIVAQALGLEAGGAIGIPLYIAQALSAAMYAYAFSEAWGYVFPSHPPRLVALVGFGLIAMVAWRSSGLAMRAQAVMLGVVVLAVSSAFLGWGFAPELHRPQAFAPTTDLQGSFAIFFPAVTGIMVGAGMSGSLSAPRHSLPRGTLWAWLVTTVVYVLGAVWYATIATPDELRTNTLIMVERAAFGPLVIGGLLCSTLMASLSSLVASPKLLAAMAEHGVVPFSGWLQRQTDAGEPRNAVLATTLLAGLGLLAGSLDAIAPVITSFFILTYLTINLVVFVEYSLGMISWRPTFRVPGLVPGVGVAICLLGLFTGNPIAGWLSLVLVGAVYALVGRQNLDTPWETVHSGALVSLSAWAARRAAPIGRSERAWKPDLLVPVSSEAQTAALIPLLESLAGPIGTVRFVGLEPKAREVLPTLVEPMKTRGFDATWTVIDTRDPLEGIAITMDALHAALFPPNLVLLDAEGVPDDEIAAYMALCKRLQVGLVLHLAARDTDHAGGARGVNVALSDRSPDWALELHVANLDLPVLVGWLASQAWQEPLRLLTVVRAPEHLAGARDFINRLVDQARLGTVTPHVVQGGFLEELAGAPPARLHLLGMPPTPTKEQLETIRDAAGGACLFLMDSGAESALA